MFSPAKLYIYLLYVCFCLTMYIYINIFIYIIRQERTYLCQNNRCVFCVVQYMKKKTYFAIAKYVLATTNFVIEIFYSQQFYQILLNTFMHLSCIHMQYNTSIQIKYVNISNGYTAVLTCFLL